MKNAIYLILKTLNLKPSFIRFIIRKTDLIKIFNNFVNNLKFHYSKIDFSFIKQFAKDIVISLMIIILYGLVYFTVLFMEKLNHFDKSRTSLLIGSLLSKLLEISHCYNYFWTYAMSYLNKKQRNEEKSSFFDQGRTKKRNDKEISKWDERIILEFLKSFINIRMLYDFSAQISYFLTKKWKNRIILNNLSKLFDPDISHQEKWAIIKDMRTRTSIYPFPILPNVSKFKVKSLSRYHPILKYFGIYKRMKPATFEKQLNKNGNMNKYLIRMEKYLNRTAGESRFWTLGLILLSRSTSFRMAQLIQTHPKWYKQIPLKDVFRLLKKYNELNLELFNFRRKNIPKPGTDKMRPLGIPSEDWRMLQTGLNMILLIWLKIYQHPNQHGFTPGKGTTSAWDQINSDVIPSKYIYEFDFEKFFDRVNLDFLHEKLKEMGVPQDISLLMVNWSRIPPQMDKELWNKVKTGEMNLKDAQSPATDLTWSSEEERITHFNKHFSLKNYEFDFYKGSRDRTASWGNNYCYFNGVAQGSPLSPTLSTIILVPLLFLNKEKVNVLMYADDGLLYSNKPFNPDDILEFPIESGIRAHKEGDKSKWVKKDGKWINSLKFTGKKFIPHSLTESNDLLSSELTNSNIQGGVVVNATKNPKPFLFNQAKAFGIATLFDKWYPLRNKIRGFHTNAGEIIEIGGSYNGLKMNELAQNTNYSGYIDSRIFLGSYENLPIQPEWNTLKCSKDSWLYDYMAEKFRIEVESNNQEVNLFTASSFAIQYLSNLISNSGKNLAYFKSPVINVHKWVNYEEPSILYELSERTKDLKIKSF